MHNHIENIRKQAKKRGVKPTTAIIKDAIAKCCPQSGNALHCSDNQDIALKLPDIIESVVTECNSGKLAFEVDDSSMCQEQPQNAMEHSIEFSNSDDITFEPTQTIVQLVKELGDRFTEDDLKEIRQLTCLLSNDVKDTESLVNSLITAYLHKRNSVLNTALTQLERGRKAQNEEMYGGLDSDFFQERSLTWQQFGSELLGLFN